MRVEERFAKDEKRKKMKQEGVGRRLYDGMEQAEALIVEIWISIRHQVDLACPAASSILQ